MLSRGMIGAAGAAVLVGFLCATSVRAELYVERNIDIQGTTPEGEYAGNLVAPDNESSCGMNPLMPRNMVCAWNASGGSDDVIGDTWIQIGETVHDDGGFQSRYMKGSKLDLATWIGQDFMADPITLCWPGGCGVFALAANRATGGGTGGDGAGIYAQIMPELNTDFGFRHALARELTPVYLSEPGLFADKLYATYIIDEEEPGTVPVSIPIDTPDGIRLIEHDWPKARIIVAFALGDPQGDEIRILSTFTDDYGGSWSTPIEIATRGYWIDSVRTPNKCKKNPGNDECKELLPQGLNQGINISAAGDSVMYVYRVFEDAENSHSIQARMSYDRGETVASEVLDLVLPYCPYDVPTLPNSNVDSIAAARTSSFPWTSHNGLYRILVYTVRQPSSDGGCFTTFDAPTDSRVMAKVGSIDGLTWSDAVEIAPNFGHGFQFQANVDCTVGECLATWWDSRFDTSRVVDYLTTVSENPKALDALDAFLNLPFLGDFNYRTSGDDEPLRVIQFRRTARVLATRIDINSGVPVPVDTPPVVVSKYRRALVDGAVREIQRDGWGIKGYRTSTVPFMGDYGWLESLGLRLGDDDTTTSGAPVWEDNASFAAGQSPLWFASFATSRNVVGQIYTARITDPVPYTKTPESTMASTEAEDEPTALAEAEPDDQEETRSANAVEDFNPDADFCAPTGTLEPGAILNLNNRTKDFDNFGTFIKDEVSVFTSNPTKSYNIPRSYNIVIENETIEPRQFRLNIPFQPVGAPDDARASFDQLPFDPAEFGTAGPPAVDEIVFVDEQSSETRPVFIVSAEVVNPVNVDIYEQLASGGEQLIGTITLNGTVEDGAFLNEDGSINAFEIHNPRVYYPDEFAPDEFAPDEYAPDEFAPDLYTPDEFAASQFNPDEFAPDEFAPDEFAPDEFAPDEFAPDEFAPDEFAPDEFAAPLRDEATLDNPEIPFPDTGTIEGQVVKKDINYALENIGNNTTGYTMDFEMVEPTIRDLIASGQLVVQVIAWQDKKIADVQFCEPRIISENRVIAATTDFDFLELSIPDINNNSVGALTVVVVPKDLVQITIRFIAPLELMLEIYPLLTAGNISSVFASMSANTDARELVTDETLIFDNRVPPSFPDFLPIDSTTFEAEGPDGIYLDTDFVQAERDGESVDVTCDPPLPTQVPLDIRNDPQGPTPFLCTATTDNGVSSQVELDVFVLDTTAPTVDLGTLPDLIVEAVPGGTTVDYTLPTATDFNGVDPAPVVTCNYMPGDEIPFVAPGPTTTTVQCEATDESGNVSDPVDVFAVTVRDTSAPEIDGLSPPDFTPDVPRFVLGDDESMYQLQWGPFSVSEAGLTPDVDCEPGDINDALSSPADGRYVFDYAFPVGTTVVQCSATDSLGQTSTASFSVTIFDETAPTITLLGDTEITIGLGETYVDPGVEVSDNSTPAAEIDIDIDSSAVDNTALGTYPVTITATDASGNEATATRTVQVGYAGGTGIRPTKLLVEQGSSNALFYGWLDENGNLLNVRGDTQIMRIREDSCAGPVVLIAASDKGNSGFRFKNDNEIQFNWEVEGAVGKQYCAEAESGTTGQTQLSPLMEIK